MKRRYINIISSLFFRYLLSYMALVLVIFSSIGVYINIRYDRQAREQYVQMNRSHLQNVMTIHSENLSQMRNIATQISLMPTIRPFKLISSEGVAAMNIRNQLQAFVTNSFIKDLFLKFDIDDYVYTTTTSIHIDMLLEKGFVMSDTTPEDLKRSLTEITQWHAYPSQTIKGILPSNIQDGVSFFFPIELQVQSIHYGTLGVLVDSRDYAKLFDSGFDWPLDMYIVHNKTIIAQASENMIPAELIQQSIDEAVNYKELTHNGKRYILLAEYDSRNSISYALVAPAQAYTDMLRLLMRPVLFFMLMLSLLCFVLIYFLSKNNYEPIRNLRKHIAFETEGGDLDAIKISFNNLVDSNKNLTSRLDKSQNMRKADFIRKFAGNTERSRSDMLEEAQEAGIKIDCKYFMMIMLGADETNLFNIGDPVLKPADEDIDGYFIELLADNRLLGAFFSDSKESLLVWAKDLQDKLKAQEEFLAVSASGIHNDFKEASISYMEAVTAFDNRFIQGNNNILFFEPTKEKVMEKVTFVYPVKQIKALHLALRLKDYEAIKLAVYDLHTYFTITPLSLFEFRCIYNEVLNTIAKEYFERGAELEPDIYNLSGCLSLDDLSEKLIDTCVEILHKAGGSGETKLTVIGEVVDYIRTNFTDPELSLSGVAQKFLITPKRLSLDFKQAVGMIPSDYLLMLRMNRAKELLQTTNLPVKEICIQVGYYDFSGFNNRFKKYTFLTPLQYRKLTNDEKSVE